MRRLKSWLRPLGFGLLVSLGFSLGSCFHQWTPADKAPYRGLKTFAKVLQYIETHFVDKVEPEKLIEGAIRGMLQTLDPHSAYLSPEVYRDLREETSGSFGGLGVQVSIKKRVLTVIAPIEGSPAYKAGVLAGDRIVQIDGQSTKDMSLPDAAVLMKGKPGTEVVISIQREGVEKAFEIKIVRQVVSLSTVRSSILSGHIGYLRVSSFAEKTAREVEAAMEEIKKDKALAGWILDLRGNPGGLLDQAVRVSNLFLDEGPIVYTIGRDRAQKEIEKAHPGRKISDLPLVVLLDAGSASASEIVAGALKDHGRAVIAGQPSFGKGSVQSIVSIGDDAGLKLTVARYYTPAGRSIQAQGIEPDVMIDELDTETLKTAKAKKTSFREKDLQGHLSKQDSDSKESNAISQGKTKQKLREKAEEDYTVAQAMGILRTMKLVRSGTKKPEFKLDEKGETSTR